MSSTASRSALRTLLVVSAALFMTSLDNLIVTVALPSIRADLGASIEGLEWTVNAYTLTFAVLLIPAAALGDRFGRRRVFLVGLALFTLASAAAALAPSTGALVLARALQGAGGAVIAPLSLTLLADAYPPERRGLALGVWAGVSGFGVAVGPLLGGLVVEGLAWQWIFWLNVPLGLLLLPLAASVLRESHGPSPRLDLPGVALVGAGLLGVVLGLVRGNADGWTSAPIVASLAGGVVLLGAFLAWERRAAAPMVPLALFGSRAFAATNAVGFVMFFGMFGSIFLLTQVLQFALGAGPLDAGVKMLAWTGTIAVVAPLAGATADRVGPRAFLTTGLALQGAALLWMASVTEPGLGYGSLVVPFVMAGAGMALCFAPSTSAILAAVRPEQAGQASGVANAIRELGGVFGVAILASVFSAAGGYASPQAFTDGAVPAVTVGGIVVLAGALLALVALPSQRRAAAQRAGASPSIAPAS
ncbi:MAG TPA: DHA2 family efflux MFS transporter permease subunit [Solirubrobacteraceae bacterium]|nr:DHA2 family efflux MFS transporter permease subunit [Solirubrobacteraceae bacterium]